MKKTDSIENKISAVLDNLRPYLNSDGGDIEFIKFEEGTVFIKLSGACDCCPHKNQTIKGGLLSALKNEIPEVEDVINVEL